MIPWRSGQLGGSIHEYNGRPTRKTCLCIRPAWSNGDMAARVEYQEIAMVLFAEKIGSTKVVAASRTFTAQGILITKP